MLTAKFKDKDLNIGDTLKVKYNIIEGGKVRVQAFEGVLISLKGRGVNKTFTIRKIGDRSIGVERIWPLDSKSIVDIELVKKSKNVRRSKLYFLRKVSGKMSSYI